MNEKPDSCLWAHSPEGPDKKRTPLQRNESRKRKLRQDIGPAEARSAQVLTPSSPWGIPDPIILSPWVGDKPMSTPYLLALAQAWPISFLQLQDHSDFLGGEGDRLNPEASAGGTGTRYCERAGLGSPGGTWSSYSETYKIEGLCPGDNV